MTEFRGTLNKKAQEIEDNFKLDHNLVIDINNLHTEDQFNSELYFIYRKKVAKLKYIVEQFEELKKQTRSRLINDCIRDPSLCDPISKKFSDRKAEAYYRCNQEYINVIDELLKASYELTCYEGAEKAFYNRGWSLKNLKDYALSEYFESSESKKTRKVFVTNPSNGNESGSVPENVKKAAGVEKKSGGVSQDKFENKTVTPRRSRRARG